MAFSSTGLQRPHGRQAPLLPTLQRVRHPSQLPQERFPGIQLSRASREMAFRVSPLIFCNYTLSYQLATAEIAYK